MTELMSSKRSCGKSSQTTKVSTAPISKQFKVSLDAETKLAGILRYLIEKFTDEFLFGDEFHVRQRVRGELNGLGKSVIATVGDIDDVQHLRAQSSVKNIRLASLFLKSAEPLKSIRDVTLYRW